MKEAGRTSGKTAAGRIGPTGSSLIERSRYLPFHPFLLVLIPLFLVFDHNANQLPIAKLGVPAAIELGAVAALFLVLRMLSADTRKAGVVTSLIIVLVLYYQIAFVMVAAVLGQHLVHEVFLPAWAAIFALALWRTSRSRADFSVPTLCANIIAACIFAYALLGIATYQVIAASKRPAAADWSARELPAASAAAANPARDIYYLVFDQYASADILRDIYGFDNSAFLDRLAGRGFYVVSNGAANYLRTAHSLASTLNLQYLDNLSETMGEESDDWLPLYRMLEDHTVWRFLKQRGYRFIHMGSWWDATENNRFADENYNWMAIPDLIHASIEISIIGGLGAVLGSDPLDFRTHQCQRVRYKFEKLAEVARSKESTFAFAHILTPHSPFVFDREGRCLSRDEAHARGRTQNYVEQVMFVNRMILKLVDDILAVSDTEPIIVIQSDEGPWPERYAGHDFGFRSPVSVDWTEASAAELREKFKILNTLYLPGPVPAPLHPGITPVNTFRIIFNRYFGTNLALLPDEHFVHVDDQHLYKFVNVSDIVR